MNSAELLAKLFQVSPVALALTRLRDSRYLEVNDAFERATGWPRNEVVGRTSVDLNIWVDPSDRTRLLERVANEPRLQNLDITLRRKDGQVRKFLAYAEVIEVDDEACALTALTDITDRVLEQAALREREEHFRAIANTVPVTIWATDADRRTTYVNQASLEFTGRPLEAELGFGWIDTLHPDDVEACMALYMAAYDRRAPFQTEYRLRRHDGEYRWFLAVGAPRYDPNGDFTGYIGSATDISDRKRLEEAVSQLSQRLIDAHEEERTHLARELHDDINQRLTALALNLHVFKQGLPASAVDAADDAIEKLRNLVKDLQALSYGLHSPRLELLGLAAAAEDVCKDLAARQGVAIDFRATKVPESMPQDVALCLFRILQEALQNAIRHSGARDIRVRLTGDGDYLELTVHDSGKGFEVSDALKSKGLGLSSMPERLKLVGGQLTIETKPGGGTTIRALAPLAATTSARRTRGDRSHVNRMI